MRRAVPEDWLDSLGGRNRRRVWRASLTELAARKLNGPAQLDPELVENARRRWIATACQLAEPEGD
jgi:hypothetical protein